MADLRQPFEGLETIVQPVRRHERAAPATRAFDFRRIRRLNVFKATGHGPLGMPTPPQYLANRRTDPGVTNIRQVKSSHWRQWLGPEHRWVVPFTSFSENENLPDGSRPPVWFALDESRPLAFFAGIWAS